MIENAKFSNSMKVINCDENCKDIQLLPSPLQRRGDDSTNLIQSVSFAKELLNVKKGKENEEEYINLTYTLVPN